MRFDLHKFNHIANIMIYTVNVSFLFHIFSLLSIGIFEVDIVTYAMGFQYKVNKNADTQ